MQPTSLAESWNLEQILDDLNEFGFALIDDVYSNEYVHSLVHECTSHLAEFRAAGVQNGVVSHIRSDHILWIDGQLPIAQQHLKALEEFSQALNQAFYLGIKEVEAHFACYNAGEFYALHRDNPQQKNDRMISTVFYVHESWQEDWGGQLRLQDKNGQWHIIQPSPNRLAIFQSDLLHEVLRSKQQRLSITAWLRSGSSIWNQG
ncbi:MULTISPECIES: 2OG-Fe(II) oxygenase [Acinetobacter]|uniref:2OG-Fe(II) oxygenase n=1 Tax=Acinetobacter TaxID=469 RepID=UPI0021D3DCC6|nr:2OG-Fe(II) oxygenase [Acinetobacter courvalinii]MCU4369897.1 2OG-Fe(II) oxygenase [Acinetobacter courvalinii]MCU4448029.1 2OG-Fe(II) oxygenase [Acinetobacter courvalinii]WPE80987.1 2OG-Fe(II) oxygenase [Acinetobacter baumannii]